MSVAPAKMAFIFTMHGGSVFIMLRLTRATGAELAAIATANWSREGEQLDLLPGTVLSDYGSASDLAIGTGAVVPQLQRRRCHHRKHNSHHCILQLIRCHLL
jgi:hypothetical protein